MARQGITSEAIDGKVSLSSSVQDSGFPVWMMVVVPILSFGCELVDTALGMGYGTTLTPVLMTPSFGLAQKVIVQSILVSELLTGTLAVVFHTLFKNVSIGIDLTRFLPRRIRDHIDKTAAKAEKDAHILLMKGDVVEEGSESACQDVIAVVDVEPPPGPHQRSPISPADPVPFDSHQQRTDASPSPAPSDSPKPLSRVERLLAWLNSRTTIDFQIIVVMALTGIVGTFVSGGIGSIKNSGLKFAIKIYIGAMVLSMGVVIFLFTCRKWSIRFAIWKIALLGAVTGFNKGISGGGYGPISVSGQVISGRPERNAIATTSASEAVICLSGIIASFAFATGSVKENYALVPWLIIGSCVSVPFSAYATRVVRTKPLRYIVAVSTTILGCYAIVSAVLAYLKIWNSGGGGG